MTGKPALWCKAVPSMPWQDFVPRPRAPAPCPQSGAHIAVARLCSTPPRPMSPLRHQRHARKAAPISPLQASSHTWATTPWQDFFPRAHVLAPARRVPEANAAVEPAKLPCSERLCRGARSDGKACPLVQSGALNAVARLFSTLPRPMSPWQANIFPQSGTHIAVARLNTSHAPAQQWQVYYGQAQLHKKN